MPFPNCNFQVSHVASVEGLPILDCSTEVSCINFMFAFLQFFIYSSFSLMIRINRRIDNPHKEHFELESRNIFFFPLY